MTVDSKNTEKQEIIKRYREAERKLILAEEEASRLANQVENLKLELAASAEKIQTLLAHVNS